MSTEQGQGKPRPNSDIYSLGIIGIQSLTGLHPINFEEDPDTGEISWQHQANVSSSWHLCYLRWCYITLNSAINLRLKFYRCLNILIVK